MTNVCLPLIIKKALFWLNIAKCCFPLIVKKSTFGKRTCSLNRPKIDIWKKCVPLLVPKSMIDLFMIWRFMNVVEVLYKCLRQNNYAISFLFSGLDSRNATYASIAFISGVGQKNPSTGCEVTAFWKSD